MTRSHKCGESGTYTDKNGVTRCKVCKADAPPPYTQDRSCPGLETDD